MYTRRSTRSWTFYIELERNEDGTASDILVRITGVGRIFSDNISLEPSDEAILVFENGLLPNMQAHLDTHGKTWIELIRDQLPRGAQWTGDMLVKPLVDAGFASYRGNEVTNIKLTDDTAFVDQDGAPLDLDDCANETYHLNVEMKLKGRLRFESRRRDRKTEHYSPYGVGKYSPSFSAVGVQVGDKASRRSGASWTSPFKKAKPADRGTREVLAW